MATVAEWSCPICHDAEHDVAYVTPCLHQFCLGCIVRWAKRKPSCPLCRQTVNSIIYSVRSEHDFLEIFAPRRSDPSVVNREDAQGPAEPSPRTYVAGFQPEFWASLFRESLEMLEPVLPWLHQELSVLYGARWWEVDVAQSTVIANLCRYGLDEEALVRELQPLLQHQTVTFVHRLISVAADRCSEQLLREMELLDTRGAEEQEEAHGAEEQEEARGAEEREDADAAEEQQDVRGAEEHNDANRAEQQVDSPAATPGPTASSGGTPVPSSSAHEEPYEELGQAVAGPSAPTQGRDCSHRGPRHPPKRRASGSQDSSAHKRPCRRQQ